MRLYHVVISSSPAQARRNSFFGKDFIAPLTGICATTAGLVDPPSFSLASASSLILLRRSPADRFHGRGHLQPRLGRQLSKILAKSLASGGGGVSEEAANFR